MASSIGKLKDLSGLASEIVDTVSNSVEGIVEGMSVEIALVISVSVVMKSEDVLMKDVLVSGRRVIHLYRLSSQFVSVSVC